VAHIYVVDDDEQLLRMVGLMLERGGHIATLVNNPVEALELMTDDAPDMAILDVMMPGMSGHDLCRSLRAHDVTQQMPVMILTARAQEDDRQTAMQGGADDYLSKPVTSQELLSRVDRLLSKKRSTNTLAVQPKILAVYGLTGGVGRTTVAANLAAQLRVNTKAEICLVDFTTSGGQLGMQFDVQEQKSWANVINTNPLDWKSIRSQMVTHESGLHILPAPSGPMSPTFPTASLAERILALLREHMAFVIVDLPAALNDGVRAALRMADMAYHIIAPNRIAIQTAALMETALRSAGIGLHEMSYILNQGAFEPQMSKGSVERTLNTRLSYHITFDPNQQQAIVQGKPVCLTGAQSTIPLTIQKLAAAQWEKATLNN
jgi:DNA-binding response OmpR family regulator